MSSVTDTKRSAPATVITVAGFESGAGKTQAALHLAGGLAAQGAQVLLLDSDKTNPLAVAFGLSSAQLRALDEAKMTFSATLLQGLPIAISLLIWNNLSIPDV
jgi:cellulose biosynthesis protein BcsQ